MVEVWLDGAFVPALSGSGVNLRINLIDGVQSGDVQTARTYDIVYDDAAFGTQRLGQ